MEDTDSIRGRVEECILADVITLEQYSLMPTSTKVDVNAFEILTECAMPNIILSEMAKPDAVCFMGLLPAIQHAWVSVNTTFFLWNYEAKLQRNREVVYLYDELDQTVTCATVAPPAPGMLLDEIKHVLVLTTATEIILLGVCYSRLVKDETPEVVLCPTQLSVAAEGVHMTCMVGLPNGRIFMGGRDGMLYELVYTNQDGWFSSRCRKINHSRSLIGSLVPQFLSWNGDSGILHMEVDLSRKILIVLTKKSSIEVWWLGKDLGQMQLSCSLSGIDKTIKSKYHIPSLVLHRVHPLPPLASSSLHIVAVAVTGHRVFLELKFDAPVSFLNPLLASPPTSIGVANLLEPPDNTSLSTFVRNTQAYPNQNASVLMSSHSQGMMIVVVGTTHDPNDQLLCISPDPAFQSNPHFIMSDSNWPPSNSVYNESIRVLEGRSATQNQREYQWGQIYDISADAIQLKEQERVGLDRALFEAGYIGVTASQSRLSFTCLSFAGVRRVAHVPVIQQLKKLLDQRNLVPDTVDRFFQLHGKSQVCALCVRLAWLHSVSGPFPNRAVAETAANLLIRMGGSPQMITGTDNISTATFSALHWGVYLEAARCLSVVWGRSLCTVTSSGAVVSNISLDVMATLRLCLQLFVVLPPLINKGNSLTSTNINKRLLAAMRDFPAIAEGSSLHALHSLIIRAHELVVLLQLISTKSNLSRILNDSSDSDTIPLLRSLKFEDICLTEQGRAVGKRLATSLLKEVEKDPEQLHNLTQTMNIHCGSYFTPQDRKVYRARLMLHSEADTLTFDRKEELCREALKLLTSDSQTVRYLAEQVISDDIIAEPLPLHTSDLMFFCERFCALEQYQFVPQLALSCARELNPDERTDEVPNPRLVSATPEMLANARTMCYNCVLQSLQLLESVASDRNEQMRKSVLAICFQSTDALFLETLFKFLLLDHRNRFLVQLKTPVVESFLRKHERLDLLWQLYLHNRHFEHAAQILKSLAEREGPPPPGAELTGWPKNLQERITYLNYAIIYLQESDTRIDPTFLADLQDTREIAELQYHIKQSLGPDRTQMHELLDHHLLSISDLYNKFTKPLGLHEISLEILRVAQHNDPDLPCELWRCLLEDTARQGQDGRWRSVHIQGKMAEWASKFSQHPTVFPLEFICRRVLEREYQELRMLEKLAIPDGTTSTAWIAVELHKAQISLAEIYMVYDRLYQGLKDTPELGVQVLYVLTDLLTWWHKIKRDELSHHVWASRVNDYLSGFNVRAGDPNHEEYRKRLRTVQAQFGTSQAPPPTTSLFLPTSVVRM